MKLLTAAQVQRIFDVTDALRLHRHWVVVPLAASESGREFVLPDGKLLIRAPGGDAFEPWLAGLRRRLDALDLTRTPRAHQHDTPALKTPPPEAPPGSGPRKYLAWGR